MTHPRMLADLTGKDTGIALQASLSSLAADVPNMVANSHRKASPPRLATHKPIWWHLKNTWRSPESLVKVILIPMSLHPHLKYWL